MTKSEFTMIYFFVCLSLLFSFFALVLPGLNADDTVSSIEILNLLGVTITGISFMVACFFVLKAVDAYSQLKKITGYLEEIRSNKEKLKREVDTLTQTRNEVFSTTSEATKSIFTSINETLYVAAESEVFSPEVKFEIMKLTKISMRYFGRLSFIKHLPTSDRIDYLQKLGQHGSGDDLKDLRKLIQDPTESEEIRSRAVQAYEKIEELLEEERKNQNSSTQS